MDATTVNVVISALCAGGFSLVLILGLGVMFCYKRHHEADDKKRRRIRKGYIRPRGNIVGRPRLVSLQKRLPNQMALTDRNRWTWVPGCVYTVQRDTAPYFARGSLSGLRSPRQDAMTLASESRSGRPLTSTATTEPF